MNGSTKRRATTTATFVPRETTDKTLQNVMAQILKQRGCANCGRVARISIEFLTDPDPEVASLPGVIDVEHIEHH